MAFRLVCVCFAFGFCVRRACGPRAGAYFVCDRSHVQYKFCTRNCIARQIASHQSHRKTEKGYLGRAPRPPPRRHRHRRDPCAHTHILSATAARAARDSPPLARGSSPHKTDNHVYTHIRTSLTAAVRRRGARLARRRGGDIHVGSIMPLTPVGHADGALLGLLAGPTPASAMAFSFAERRRRMAQRSERTRRACGAFAYACV